MVSRAIAVALALAMSGISSTEPAEVHEQKQEKSSNRTDTRKVIRPSWSELTFMQKQILAPLAATWPEMSATQRRKWMAIAGRYPALGPEKQQRLQKRMTAWARLSAAERQKARENYQKLQKLSPTRRQEVLAEWRRDQEAVVPGKQLGSPPESTLIGAEEAEGGVQESDMEQRTRK